MPSSKRNTNSDGKSEPEWRSYEKLAAKFFEQHGYEILERNWRAGRKEVDLIVRKSNLIIFVEVKSASNKKFGHPAERVNRNHEHLSQ